MASSIVRQLIDEAHTIFADENTQVVELPSNEVLEVQDKLNKRYLLHRSNSKKALAQYKIEKKLSQNAFDEKLQLLGQKLASIISTRYKKEKTVQIGELFSRFLFFLGDESTAIVKKFFEEKPAPEKNESQAVTSSPSKSKVNRDEKRLTREDSGKRMLLR